MAQECGSQSAVGLSSHNHQEGPEKLLPDTLYGGVPSCSTWHQLAGSVYTNKTPKHDMLHLPAAAAYISCHILSMLGHLEDAMYWSWPALAGLEPRLSPHRLASNSTVSKRPGTSLKIIRALAALL